MSQVLYDIEAMPTIDPEMLPIVQELREQLAQVTAERDALKLNPPVEIETSTFELAAQLAKVTVERDAAIDEFENVGMFGDSICRYCGCAEKCNVDETPEYCQNFYWRGLQEEKNNE